MNLKIRALALAVFCQLLSAPAFSQAAQSADFIVAVVNSEPITNSEVRTEVRRTEVRLRELRQQVPPAAELQRLVLDRLINDRAQLQFAQETGVRMDDAAVTLAEQNMARQNQISVDELHRNVAKDGLDVASFRRQLRNQMVLSRVQEREVESRIRISEPDIDRYLQDLQANNTDPFAMDINLAQILIAVPEKASPEQVAALLATAQKALQRVRAGEAFAKVMQDVSAADRSNGGQLGLRKADRYPPAFVEATQQLGVGGVSELIRTGAGFHILQVVEKRLPTTFTKSIVQTHARHILLRPTAALPEAAVVARLADFRKRIQSGAASFGTLAQQNSQDGSAPQGGDLGWASPGMFVPEFESVMANLKEGELSNPVVSRFGVHLIQVTERRRVDMTPREVRDWARAALKETRMEQAYVAWAQDIRNRAFVEMREPPQ